MLKNEKVNDGEYFFSFPIKSSSCYYGQIYQKSNASEFGICTYCSPGSYSLDLYGQCLQCPLGADCSEGLLDLKIGYWRYKNKIFECDPFPSSCKGGIYPGEQSCLDNYYGALCQSCKTSYYKNPIYYSCDLCFGTWATILGVIGSFVFYLILNIIMAK